MSDERLQKILSRAGVASRREAETLIAEGRVYVNGKAATLGDKADPSSDVIKVDGRRVKPPTQAVYLVLNKPKGYLSTRNDPEGRPTVYELLPPAFRKRVKSVGRLDFASEGLLLFTDDGDFSQRVAHPSHGCAKTYRVKVKGRPEAKALARLSRGITIEGRKTGPARIHPESGSGTPAGHSWWIVEISEGRTRQIREMFQRIGHPVQKLRRIAIGGLSDPRLPPGACRELTAAEVRKLGKR